VHGVDVRLRTVRVLYNAIAAVAQLLKLQMNAAGTRIKNTSWCKLESGQD
jgi:hypothetical protein